MNITISRHAVLIGVLLCVKQLGLAQGTFVNLGFESPIPPLIRDEFFMLPIANALPGWTGYIGSSQVDSVVYNTRALDSAAISLHSSASPNFQPILGNYSVFLQAASIFAPPAGAAIAQSGQVPANAQSLFFVATFSSLQVTFKGQVLQFISVGNVMSHTLYGSDVSMFAGQTGELRFAAPQLGTGGGSAFLDPIGFSNQPVPEPSVIALLAFAGAGLVWHLRRRVTSPH